MRNVYDNEIWNCIRMGFDEFIEILDQICDCEDSRGLYWDVDTEGKFYFRHGNTDLSYTFSDLKDYFDVRNIGDVVCCQGIAYILYR